MDAGRVGMLSILFDFVRENRRCWMIGDGNVRHQCIYAQDLFEAMFLSFPLSGINTFNIGTDRISTIKEMCKELIAHAKSGSRITSVPSIPTTAFLKLLYCCGLSPLGPYQFRMLTRDFSFNIAHIKTTLRWQPTLSNGQMLTKAYDYYTKNIETFLSDCNLSANRGRIRMGVFNFIRMFS